MDRKDFLQRLLAGTVFVPAASFAEAGGSLQRQEIVVTVHKDPG